MSAEIRRLFPEGLRNNEAERGKPRHDPPLRFSPSKSLQADYGEDTKSKSITVELGQKMTMKVIPYVFLDVESFLGYQKQHTYILDQQDAKAKWENLEKGLKDTNLKIDAISPNSITPEEKSNRKKLVELRDSLRKKWNPLSLRLSPSTSKCWPQLFETSGTTSWRSTASPQVGWMSMKLHPTINEDKIGRR